MIEADQIYVRSESVEAVREALVEALNEAGFKLEVDRLPKPDNYGLGSIKEYRHFFIGGPAQGWLCLLECFGGDRGLAVALSARLEEEVIWISYSERVEELEFEHYRRGELLEERTIRPSKQERRRMLTFLRSRSRTSGERLLADLGEELVRTWGLPWGFYSFEEVEQAPDRDEHFQHMNFRKTRPRQNEQRTLREPGKSNDPG